MLALSGQTPPISFALEFPGSDSSAHQALVRLLKPGAAENNMGL